MSVILLIATCLISIALPFWLADRAIQAPKRRLKKRYLELSKEKDEQRDTFDENREKIYDKLIEELNKVVLPDNFPSPFYYYEISATRIVDKILTEFFPDDLFWININNTVKTDNQKCYELIGGKEGIVRFMANKCIIEIQKDFSKKQLELMKTFGDMYFK